MIKELKNAAVKAVKDAARKPNKGDIHTIQPVGGPWLPKPTPKPKKPSTKR